MANCLDYAKIAYVAYFKAANQYYENPPGHRVDDWKSIGSNQESIGINRVRLDLFVPEW